MFNAETVMIGFASGALGVSVTYVLCLIVDSILNALTGIENLKTEFPFWVALLLIGISVVLTLIAGIIPSRSASKKDPVVALRTE
jgi:putative ABC transport system permease protein